MVYFVFKDSGDAYDFCGVWANKEDAIQAALGMKARSQFPWAPDRYFISGGTLNEEFTNEQYQSIGWIINEVK